MGTPQQHDVSILPDFALFSIRNGPPPDLRNNVERCEDLLKRQGSYCTVERSPLQQFEEVKTYTLNHRENFKDGRMRRGGSTNDSTAVAAGATASSSSDPPTYGLPGPSTLRQPPAMGDNQQQRSPSSVCSTIAAQIELLRSRILALPDVFPVPYGVANDGQILTRMIDLKALLTHHRGLRRGLDRQAPVPPDFDEEKLASVASDLDTLRRTLDDMAYTIIKWLQVQDEQTRDLFEVMDDSGFVRSWSGSKSRSESIEQRGRSEHRRI